MNRTVLNPSPSSPPRDESGKDPLRQRHITHFLRRENPEIFIHDDNVPPVANVAPSHRSQSPARLKGAGQKS